jgi:betaine reductase
MLRVVHYINQFFGGIGGEEKADAPLSERAGAVGPGRLLATRLADQAEVVATLICGDNYMAEHEATTLEEVRARLAELKPDALVAGPAFNAGRYGMACGAVCAAAEALGIPAVTGLYPENPAVESYRAHAVIVPTGNSAAGMAEAMSQMARLALKLAKREPLGPTREEGYIPRGFRLNTLAAESGAERAVAMLLAKLRGEPFETELRMERFELVPPAPPVADLSKARVALVTEAGLFPPGNPDRVESTQATRWGHYSLEGLNDLTEATHHAIHGGYDNHWVNADPDRVLPVDALRALEREGAIGHLYGEYCATVGNGGSPEVMRRIGAEMAERLNAAGVSAVVLTST